MQRIFGDADSPWLAPRFAELIAPIRQLIEFVGENVVFTRFVAPEVPRGSWSDYYRVWPFALQSPASHDYQIVDELDPGEFARIDATTFSKWTPELAAMVPEGSRVLLCGVSTDCCVLSTALAAADAGARVTVVADACAGVDDETHRRALSLLELYEPLVEVATVADVVDSSDDRE